MVAAETRADVTITPWSDLVVALGQARLAAGKDDTLNAAMDRTRDLLPG